MLLRIFRGRRLVHSSFSHVRKSILVIFFEDSIPGPFFLVDDSVWGIPYPRILGSVVHRSTHSDMS